MKSCSRCKKEKNIDEFMKGSKELKQCLTCREKNKSRIKNDEDKKKKLEQTKRWREKNKDRISAYNKLHSNKEKSVRTIVLRKKGTEDYTKYYSLQECCDNLNIHKSNLHKMLNGKLKSTGGYEGYYGDIETIKPKIEKKWDDVKIEKGYNKKIISSKRTKHEIIDDIEGKKCCRCKLWKPLINYNNSKNSWDGLRNDCQDCLVIYRKKNRKKITQHYLEYERNRKKIDPEFKLIKTLRSRLNSAIKVKNASKFDNTLNLTGCSLTFLKGYLEAKFVPGMTWDNHGKWHIDHIKPCCSFNMLDEEEQKKCFHYTNLQPLWAVNNLSKSGKL